MKRTLLAFGLVALAGSVSFAQTANVPPPVSKAEYAQKANSFTTLISKNKTEEAKPVWEDLHKMLLAELNVTRAKVRAAAETHNDADKTHYTQAMMKQRGIYAEIVKMKNDPATGKEQLSSKLSEFGTTIE